MFFFLNTLIIGINRTYIICENQLNLNTYIYYYVSITFSIFLNLKENRRKILKQNEMLYIYYESKTKCI